jgi:hypothetical protein
MNRAQVSAEKPEIVVANGLSKSARSTGPDISDHVSSFAQSCSPLESKLYVLVEARTGARYLECHIQSSRLVSLSTVDVPLDPDEQADYRANREIVEDHFAFERMKSDALARRSFSNLVTEYSDSFDQDHPLKIIGGQHRYVAIKEALERGVDECHGVKVYFGLDADQRLDVQVISNTISLFRMTC